MSVFFVFTFVFLFQLQSAFSENVYIRAFDLGGGGLKTALFVYSQEMQTMKQIEDQTQLGHCPDEEEVSKWLRTSMKDLIQRDLDEEIHKGYSFGFSLAGLNKLRSKPLSNFDMSIICAIPRNKIKCIGDEIAHLIASLQELGSKLPKGPVWNFSVGTHVGISFTDTDHKIRKLSDFSTLYPCDPRYVKEPTTGLALWEACGSSFGFDVIVNRRKSFVDDDCFLEFAGRWKAYLESAIFTLDQVSVAPGSLVFTGGYIDAYQGRLVNDLIRLGISAPLFIGPKNAGLLGAAWNVIKNDNPITNEQGQTELTEAIASQDREKVEFLLKNGADLNQRDALGYTPMSMAIEIEDLQLLELLIEYGAGVNMRSVSGASPLLLAVLKNNCKMVEILLKNKANSSIPDYWDQMPIILAQKNNNLRIQRLIEGD